MALAKIISDAIPGGRHGLLPRLAVVLPASLVAARVTQLRNWGVANLDRVSFGIFSSIGHVYVCVCSQFRKIFAFFSFLVFFWMIFQVLQKGLSTWIFWTSFPPVISIASLRSQFPPKNNN